MEFKDFREQLTYVFVLCAIFGVLLVTSVKVIVAPYEDFVQTIRWNDYGEWPIDLFLILFGLLGWFFLASAVVRAERRSDTAGEPVDVVD